MGFLVGRVFGTAEIDEVEIDAVYPCAAEIGVTQVGFANFFGGFEVLLVEFVCVKTGAAAFAGDWE